MFNKNVNEISSIILESYKLQIQSQNDNNNDEILQIQQDFAKNKKHLIRNLYELFPITRNKQNLERWKTDLSKKAVNTIAYEYGECQYLVKLCDWNSYINQYKQKGIGNEAQQKVYDEYITRFIDNLCRYKDRFMMHYFKYHENDVTSFLCVDIRFVFVFCLYGL